MTRQVVLAVVVLTLLSSIAWGQNAIRVPFQHVPDQGVFVPDEFVVVLGPQIRANVSVVQGPSGEPRVSEPTLQRLVERHGVQRFARQFPTVRTPKPGSGSPDLTGHYKVKLMAGQSLELAIRGFESNPHVARVEKIGVHPVYATPNDPYYQGSPDPLNFPYDQWHYWDTYGVDADQAWDTEAGSGDVLVGIIDSGVRYYHADLGGNVPVWDPSNPQAGGNIFVNSAEIPGNGIDDDNNGYIDDTVGWDFVTEALNDILLWCMDQDCGVPDNNPDDGEGHGTHVAGTVGAITNNNILVAGVAGGYSDGSMTGAGNGAKIIPLRIGYRAFYYGLVVGIVRMDWAAEAMVYCADLVDAGHNVAAVNCSWGSSDSGGLGAAVSHLQSRDVMIVHAAGNSADQVADYLATRPGVMNVAATDIFGNPASFTSYGSWVHVAAPGVDVVSTWTNPDDPVQTNHYTSVLSGTSMAAPHVVGIAALLEAADPTLSATDKFDLIVGNVKPYNGSFNLGSGIANAKLALDAALQGPPPPCDIAADFSASPLSGTEPLTVSFTDQSTGATSWSWNFGDGNGSTNQNPFHTYMTAGTYTVTLTAARDCGSATEVKTDYVTVDAAPCEIAADFSATPQSGDAPLTVNFTDLSSGAASWFWEFGDGNNSTNRNPSHNYMAAGTYTVTLTASSDCGSDAAVKTDYITVSDPPPPPCDITADFSSSPLSGTAPLTVNFTDQSTNATAWSWDFGDGNGSTNQNPSHDYTAPGTYTVTLTATRDCGSDTVVKTDYVTVDDVGGVATTTFVQDIAVTRNDLRKGRKQGQAVVTIYDDLNQPVANTTVEGGFTGKTNDGGLAGVTNASGQVTFTSSEAKGGRGEWCFTVTDVSHATLSYDASLNNVTQACESGVVAVSPAELPLDRTTWVYPNPFNPQTRIHFVLPEAGEVHIVIYDVSGRVVRRLVSGYYGPGSHDATFDARSDSGRSLPSGIYFYRFSGPGVTETKKMMLLK